jgi:hypothetical protein
MLEIGGNSVEIIYKDDEYPYGTETDINWGRIAEHMFFPALRAMGYVIDEEWSGQLEDSHKEYHDWGSKTKFNR